MGKCSWTHSTKDAALEVSRPAEDVVRFLLDVQTSSKCYPDLETLEGVGDNEWQWILKEKGVSTVKMQGIMRCKYSRDGDDVVWEAVRDGERLNMFSSGKFIVNPVSEHACELSVDVKLDTEIPIPSLLMGFAAKLGEREMKQTWNTYLYSIKKTVESGTVQVVKAVNKDPLGQVLADRYNPDARQKNYLEMAKEYYNAVNDLYQTGWGCHFHFGLFYDVKESVETAIKRIESTIVKAGNINSDSLVLDIGCGIGGPTCNIALQTGCQAVGLNINEKQVAQAIERAKDLGVADRVRFDIGDAMKMPYEDNKFDVITFFESVCHMPDKRAFFQECYRVLKPGGRISASDWLQCDNPTEEEIRKFVEPICAAHAVPHLGSVQSYRRDMEAVGFIVATAIDLRAEGDILRNWEILDEDMIKSFTERPKELYDKEQDPLMDMLITGGVGLSEGAKAGVFMIGRFLAMKPTTQGRWDPPPNYGRFPQAGLGIKDVPMHGKSTVAVDRVLQGHQVPVSSDVMAPNAQMPTELLGKRKLNQVGDDEVTANGRTKVANHSETNGHAAHCR